MKNGRFILGLTIPLTLMAAYGLEECFLPRLAAANSSKPDQIAMQNQLASIKRAITLLTLPSTLLFIILLLMNGLQTMPDYPLYYQQAEIEATRFSHAYHTR